ncbi:MAG: crossover junction endodeoxyribonuclease RuvC, partial [Planctomycetaceae bacterium]|nr:crossover junction endodeoxyribonuclease RuvC [Planctomycetaceae bacterium]
AAALAGVPVRQYPPATVKKAVTGRGAAAKDQVAAMVRVILGLAEVPTPADATDALAAAICDLHRG